MPVEVTLSSVLISSHSRGPLFKRIRRFRRLSDAEITLKRSLIMTQILINSVIVTHREKITYLFFLIPLQNLTQILKMAIF